MPRIEGVVLKAKAIIVLVIIIYAVSCCAAKPERNIKTLKTIDITKFGAVPNDGKSDSKAVIAAFEECKKNPGATLVFPKGRYDFFAEDNAQGPGTALLGMIDARDFTLDGRGSEFIFHGLTGAFAFARCNDITLKNFTIDWSRPPFSLGKVISVGKNCFDVDVFNEYPVSGGEPVGAYMDYDPETRLPLRHGLDEYYTATSTELVKPQVLRVHIKNEAKIKPGVWVLLRHQVYGPGAFGMLKCSDVKVSNVNVYTAPGMAFVGNNCTNLSFDRFCVVPRPSSGMLMSTTADALHLSGNKGLVSIENCEFEGMGDDAANIKSGLYLMVKSRLDDRTVLAAHNLKIPDPPDPGDTMELVHRDNMLPYATAVVKSVEMQADGVHKIEFTQPLPDEMNTGDLFGNASRVAKIRVKNCIVRNNRARGFLIQNRDVVVEDCKFKNCTSGGVWVLTEAWYFYESIGSRDVIVRNNIFENCNYGGPLGEAVLGAYVLLGPNKFAGQPGIHKNITFENNTIIGADNCAILAAGTDGITIRNNIIEQVCSNPTIKEGNSAVYIVSSKNIKMEGNRIAPKKQGSHFKDAVKIEQ